jgi:hypothetical protein
MNYGQWVRSSKRLRSCDFFFCCSGNGIRDQHQAVRNAALYALGQYSEYLQPEISEYADQVLMILFQYMDDFCARVESGDAKEPSGLDRIFYALEIFSENLNEKLVPFLPDLMKRFKLYAITVPTYPISICDFDTGYCTFWPASVTPPMQKCCASVRLAPLPAPPKRPSFLSLTRSLDTSKSTWHWICLVSQILK